MNSKAIFGKRIKKRVSGKNIFLPISIGNHFYSNEIISSISEEILPAGDNSIIVVCDRLRYLTFRLRGSQEHDARNKTDKELAEFKNRLANCGIKQSQSVKICSWSDFDLEPNFVDLLENLKSFVKCNQNILEFFNALVNERLSNFQFKKDNINILLEETYILEETALSIYFTEIKGYSIEIYARQTHGLVDEIYRNFHSNLLGMLNVEVTKRVFVAIDQENSSNSRYGLSVNRIKRISYLFINRHSKVIETVVAVGTLLFVAYQVLQINQNIELIKKDDLLNQYRMVHEHKQRINYLLLQIDDVDFAKEMASRFTGGQSLDSVIGFTIANDFQNLLELRCNTDVFREDSNLWGDVQQMVYHVLLGPININNNISPKEFYIGEKNISTKSMALNTIKEGSNIESDIEELRPFMLNFWEKNKSFYSAQFVSFTKELRRANLLSNIDDKIKWSESERFIKIIDASNNVTKILSEPMMDKFCKMHYPSRDLFDKIFD